MIDEYDVPLDKAFQAGYYDEMVILLRSLFSNALKTNPYREIKELFVSQIQQWFKETTRGDAEKMERFCMAFPNGDEKI